MGTSFFELGLNKELSHPFGSTSLQLHLFAYSSLVRSDWRSSYEHGDWAIVPTQKVLKAILTDGDLTFAKVNVHCLQSLAFPFSYLNFQPYNDFDPHGLHDYIFVLLPTLGRKNIVREIPQDEDDDDDDKVETQGEDEADVDVEDAEVKAMSKSKAKTKATAKTKAIGKGNAKAKAEDKEKDTIDIFGTAIAYRQPFLNFPDLKHHAHPFFVIYNALPKLRQHREVLPQQHLNLLFLMERIQAIWTQKLMKQPKADNNDNDDSDSNDNDNDNDNDNNTLKRVTRSMAPKLPNTKGRGTHNAKIGRGHNKAKRHGKTATALPASQASDVDLDMTFLYDQQSEVTAWAMEVSVAGSAKPTDDTVTWSDDEPVRPPIDKWEEWHVPYRQPREFAEFCSSDWPMYFYSYALWMPRMGYTG